MTPTKAEVEAVTKPTLNLLDEILQLVLMAGVLVFLLLLCFTQTSWALYGVLLFTVLYGYTSLLNTRAIASDNQRRLDFLIKNL